MRYMAACILALAAVACTEEYEYSAPEADNGGIYFAGNQNVTWVFVPGGEQTISFDVVRRDSAQARSYKLVASDSEFGIPTEVTFAAGQSRATVTAQAHLAAPALERTVTVTIDDADRYVYSNSDLKLTVSVASEVLHCQKEIYANDYRMEPCTLYNFGSEMVHGKAVTTYGACDFLGEGYMFLFTLDEDGKAEAALQEALYEVPFLEGFTEKYRQWVKGYSTWAPQLHELEFMLKYYIMESTFIYEIPGGVIVFPVNYNPLPNGATQNS